MAHGEVGTGLHGGQDDLPEALMTPRPVEGRHGLPEAVDRPTIVALGLVGCAEVEVRQRVQDDLPTGRGEREGALGRRRWPGHTRPCCGNGLTESQRSVPADAGRRGPQRGPRPRADTPGYAQSHQTARAPSAGRAGDQWPARACRAVSGRCGRALSACSKYPTASR